jgi:hypothetical protein
VLTLDRPELSTDAAAITCVKVEIVGVVFADHDGELQSREGPNRYRAGDALVTGSTGDRWSVSRDRFDTKYEAIAPLHHGVDGRYRARAVTVWAKQMDTAFRIARRAGGDVLNGLARDWILQYGPGDYGVVENTRFQQVYRRVRR